MTTTTTSPIIRAPRGNTLRCKGWQQEAALRCLMNNLDPEVAERPQDLVVYGGIGRAARNWECFHAIVHELERLGPEDTLLVQSGKPVAVFPTHEMAPRVIIANSNLVGKWATWDHFNELDRKGLMMYGQMTAGSWIYIGTQGILQGTFQTFAALAERHFGGTLKAQARRHWWHGRHGWRPALSVTLNDGVVLAIDVDRSRILRRVETSYCDTLTENLDEALRLCELARREGRALSVGLVGNCADVLPEIIRRGVQVDVVTDQTSPTIRSTVMCLKGFRLSEASGAPQTRSRRIRPPLHRLHGRPRRRHARPAALRRRHVRLRQQHPPLRLRRWLCRRLSHSRLRPRIHPPALLHRRRAPSAGSRSPAIPKTSTSPTNSPSSFSPTTKSSPAG